MSSRLALAFAEALEHARPLDAFAMYPATVLVDKSLSYDIRPLDLRLPDLTDVELLQSTPGVRFRVAPGATALLGFRSGSLKEPYIAGFLNGNLTSLSIEIGATSFSLSNTGVDVDGLSIRLGGAAAVLPIMLSTMQPSAKVKAI